MAMLKAFEYNYEYFSYIYKTIWKCADDAWKVSSWTGCVHEKLCRIRFMWIFFGAAFFSRLSECKFFFLVFSCVCECMRRAVVFALKYVHINIYNVLYFSPHFIICLIFRCFSFRAYGTFVFANAVVLSARRRCAMRIYGYKCLTS